MRLVYVEAFYDPSVTDPDQAIARAFTVHHLARCQVEVGHQVAVVSLFPRDRQVVRGGVHYHFAHPGRAAILPGRAAGWALRQPAGLFTPTSRLLPVIRYLQPDLFHFFGLTLDLNLFLVIRQAREAGWPVFIHYHGGLPAHNSIRRALQRYNLRYAAGLFFTTRSHAYPWLEQGLLDSMDRVAEVMETSSEFQVQPRGVARAETSMIGSPVILWAGRLHPLKDPLTGLRAFELIRQQRPAAQLYLYYLTDELRSEMQQFIATQPGLTEHVHFRSRVPRQQMPAIYNSSDFLIQASYREWSGLAVLEAISCGVIPAVTHIPSFWKMTNGGRYGVLFAPGNHQALAAGVLAIPPDDIPRRSAEVCAWFQRALSFPVLAQQIADAYCWLGRIRR